MGNFNIRNFIFPLFIAGTSFGVHAQELRALVVINDNSRDSIEVGNYYATQHGIASDHIVHVRVPDRYFASANDFLSLRDQILKFGICPLVPAAGRPQACSDSTLPIYTQENIDALTAQAPVRYIVLTRGVPTRLEVPGTTGEMRSTVDSYLRFYLARYLPSRSFIQKNSALYQSLGAERLKSAGLDAPLLKTLTEQISVLRPADPVADKEYIVGRIDNVDLTSAKALVDRAHSGDSVGIFGKAYTNKSSSLFFNYASPDMWRMEFGLFGLSGTACQDYKNNYLSVPHNPSPNSQTVPAAGQASQSCLVKMVDGLGESDDLMPGNVGSREPLVDNASVYFGNLHGHSPQGGFSALLMWRKNTTCTVTLCESSADPAACKAASSDPFKLIDTSCVGVAPGAIGFNRRSFTSAYMGIWPNPWTAKSPDGIADIPRVDLTQGADDSASLWFDRPDEVAGATCYEVDDSGNTEFSVAPVLCASTRTPGLAQVINLNRLSPGSATNPEVFHITYKLNVKGFISGAAQSIASAVQFEAPVPNSGCPSGWVSWMSEGYTVCHAYSGSTYVLQAVTGWQQVSADVAAPPGLVPTGATLLIDAVDTSGIKASAIGLDAISLKRAADPTELVVNGSFHDVNQFKQALDSNGNPIHMEWVGYNFAAQFLGRLGGTAFWGSTSHLSSDGSSFSDNDARNLWMWMSGVPLGDTVWLGARFDGVFYGDPMYNPTSISFTPQGGFDGHIAGAVSLSGIANNGLSDLVYASASICTGNDFYACDLAGTWRDLPDPVVTGTGANFFHQSIPYDTTTFPAYGEYVIREKFGFRVPSSSAVRVFNTYASVINRYTSQEQALYSVGGVVRTQLGIPIAGVSIVLTNGSGQVYGPIRNDGRGKFNVEGLASGQYSVSVTSDDPSSGYVFALASGAQNISIASNSLSGVDVVGSIPGGQIVSGLVKNASTGQPIAGVSIAASSNGTVVRLGETNPDGLYELDGLAAGNYLVAIADTSHWSGMQTVAVGGQNVVLNLNLVPAGGGAISGYAKDANGVNVPGANFNITNCNDLAVSSIKTNNVGFFYVPGLSTTDISSNSSCPSQTVAVQFISSNDGWKTVGAPVKRSALGGTVNYTLQYSSSSIASTVRSVSGYVFTKNTTNVRSGVEVSLFDSLGQFVMKTTTSTGGFYKFANVPPGNYTVRQGSAVQVNANAQATDVINVDLMI